jgi:O-antigen ligase
MMLLPGPPVVASVPASKRMAAASLSLNRRLFWCLLLLLVWAPLPFGSNRPWAAALLCLLTAGLLMACLLACSFGPCRVPGGYWRRLRWPLVLLVSVQGWILLQSLPLPRAWVELLSPRAATLHGPGALIPLTLDVAQTRFHLMLGLAYTSVFALVPLLVTTRERCAQLLWTLALGGAFQATYGALMALSGLEYGFFVEKYSGQGVATGTFVNRNHLAGYLVITLAAGIGLLISRLGHDSPRSLRDRMRDLLRLLLGTKFLLRLLLALMVIGLVMTRSRMGNMAFFVALTVAGATVLFASGRRLSVRMALLLLSLLLVDLVIVGRWFGAEQIAERIAQTTTSTEDRDDVAVLSLGIVRDFALTGAGAGTYYTVFPHYSAGELNGDYFTHAHNDYVELAGDLGLPAAGGLALFLLLVMARGIVLVKQSDSRLHSGIGFSVLMAGTWVLVHSAADFNLYIPANSFTLMAVLALSGLNFSENGKNSR